MSLFAIKHTTEERITHLGYGVVRYQLEQREKTESVDGDEWDIWYETIFVIGNVEEMKHWVLVTDKADGTVHIPRRDVDQIVTCEDEEAWDSYRLHADLEDAMGADA
ncbi:hypothetical protein [Corynebacterium sp.]|uniref:hypothetical protein n=1 Tax=Corynebacterium sp. TaxID=1720 RepID=UPI0025C2FF62|nr:hypothetical protein [Corynebacterium sp.]